MAAAAKRLLLACLPVAAALGMAAHPARGQEPVSGRPTAIEGPSSTIVTPSGLGLSVARDGTGGLVYLKRVGGAAHVFVSRLRGGAFGRSVQVDGSLSGASSQPVMAAGNGGLLLVAFINNGDLWAVDGGRRFGAPRLLASGAINPAISITNFGKAYLAFAHPDGGGYDVRTGYYYAGRWSLEHPPLNVAAADDAGTGDRRPVVAAAGDGVAIVVWGEGGHVYSRRVWGTQPSGVAERADAPSGGWPPAGCSEDWAGDAVVGVGGDSSYAPVAFQERLTCASGPQSRVLVNRLHASAYDGIRQADGISGPSAQGAADPQIAVSEYGHGWVTSARTPSDDAFAGWMSNYGWFQGPTSQINRLTSTAAPDPVPAIAGLSSTLVAWQEELGPPGGGEIRMRYASDPDALGPEKVVSRPGQGPTDAADGLAAAGDGAGAAAIAWIQGSPGAIRVMVDQLYQPPGAFSPVRRLAYVTRARPVLEWRRPPGWGPMSYSVVVDGRTVIRTSSTWVKLPTRLSSGPHRWRVVATNPVGETSWTRPATVIIKTVRPKRRSG